MIKFPTVWVENSPDSLQDIALNCCIKNQNTFCKYNAWEDQYELQDDLSLPFGICEQMLSISKKDMSGENFNKFINYFKDTTRTHLFHVDLSNSLVEDKSLEILTRHSIVELNISNCERLTLSSVPFISRLSNSLVSLTIGESAQIFNEPEDSEPKPETREDYLLKLFRSFEPKNESSNCLNLSLNACNSRRTNVEALEMFLELRFPLLQKLVVYDLKAKQNQYFGRILNNTNNLTYLDLSKCDLDCSDLECLTQQKQLTSLILCDVMTVVQSVPTICQLKSLRHLDISHTSEVAVIYPCPNKALKYIVDSLENLVSLDISGTNLAGRRTRERESSPDSKTDGEKTDGENLTDIPGLANRVNRPLEFLGLLNTAHDACYRHHIPAKRIAGDATEEQILIAGQAYCAREPMIQKVLNDLFQIFRFSTCQNTRLALNVVMEAMSRHLKSKHIQVSGSASLFYIVKGDDKQRFNVKMRQKIIKVLLDAMCTHFADVTMLRNACLTLIHFKIPEDVFFDYERLVSLLLIIVAPDERREEFVQRIGLYLLNSLACQVNGFNKKLVGDRGAMTIMLQLIEQRLLNNLCDEVMETAWSTMWNVTDETPINCARFLEGRGMDLFLGCLQAFPEKSELLRNMMGLLGNVAEVKDLRPHLMKDEYLSVFSELLDSKSDGIEVSYNSAGILSHIASDGEEVWSKHNITTVKREDVLSRMVGAIKNWDLNTKRNINYRMPIRCLSCNVSSVVATVIDENIHEKIRSFEPILRLLNVDHTPEVQYWAVWALANLTKVYPDKYCTLLKEEGGIDMLHRLLLKPNFPRILELAELIIKQCERAENGCNEDCEFEDSSELEES